MTPPKGMTPDEARRSLAEIPGGVFYDIPADVDGALDPGERLLKYEDLSDEEKAQADKEFAELDKRRAGTTDG